MSETLVNTPLSFRFGEDSPSIREQLNQQNIHCKNKVTKEWQKVADAITMLKARSILTADEAAKANQALADEIAKAVRAVPEIRTIKSVNFTDKELLDYATKVSAAKFRGNFSRFVMSLIVQDKATAESKTL